MACYQWLRSNVQTGMSGWIEASGNLLLLGPVGAPSGNWKRPPPGLDENSPTIFYIYVNIPGGGDRCRDKVGERDPERVDEHGTQTQQGAQGGAHFKICIQPALTEKGYVMWQH